MDTNEHPPSWANAELCQQLLLFCQKGEGISLEFKQEIPDQKRDLAKTMAAFASSDGGHILVGVEDSGSICGIADGKDAKGRDIFAQRIAGIAREVKPPIHVVVRWAVQSEKVVAVIGVEKGVEPIYYSDYKPYIRRGNTSRPAEPAEVEQVFRDRYSNASVEKNLPTTLEISKRFKKVLAQMNQKNYKELTVVDLAQAMELEAPAELDSVFEARTPPTFALIDLFTARFAVNKEWLLTGRSAPFSTTVPHAARPEEYYDYIEEVKPEVVYLVRSTSVIGECCIVLQKDEMTAWLLPDIWHVSDHVGGGGSRDLLGLYYLFKKWLEHDRHFHVAGRVLEPAKMAELYNGELFPGTIARGSRSDWWDDLIDLDHKWTKRSNSAKAYGNSFVAAQDIIRMMLTRSNSP